MGKSGKRIFKGMGIAVGLLFFIGLGVLIGLGIGIDRAGNSQRIVIDMGFPEVVADGEVFSLEERIEDRIERRIEERIVIPPLPEIQDIPEMSEFSPMPNKIYVERSPTFFEVVNGIGTILASIGLIGLGLIILVRNRRQPREKSPD